MIRREDLNIPLMIFIIGLLSLVIFHSWFSSFIGEDEWKKPTPIPGVPDNIYVWPKGLNYLGTPIPKDNEIDPFRKKIITDYHIYMNERKNNYKKWKSNK
tara:strand:- start:1622 stop:1921 length:300 start_codon:yes stop_codon:yes gene_type:complete